MLGRPGGMETQAAADVTATMSVATLHQPLLAVPVEAVTQQPRNSAL